MSNVRTDKNPGIFAKNAQTSIPNPPVPGVPYRDSVEGAANIEDGWPYELKVLSQEWNQILFELTSFTELIDKFGILGWCNEVNYNLGKAFVTGSDGRLYESLQNSGPDAGGAKDPVSQPTFWRDYLAVVNAGIADNASDISDNIDNIAINAQDIAGNSSAITAVEQSAAANANAINLTNQNVALNAGAIADNASDISDNIDNIAINAQDIAGNSSAITAVEQSAADNANAINLTNQNVALNAGAIADNASDISDNIDNIAINAQDLLDHENAIDPHPQYASSQPPVNCTDNRWNQTSNGSGVDNITGAGKILSFTSHANTAISGPGTITRSATGFTLGPEYLSNGNYDLRVGLSVYSSSFRTQRYVLEQNQGGTWVTIASALAIHDSGATRSTQIMSSRIAVSDANSRQFRVRCTDSTGVFYSTGTHVNLS